MAKVTDLESVRAEKATACDYCGEPEHKGAFECKRITRVKFDNENDTVTVYLLTETVKVPVAGRD